MKKQVPATLTKIGLLTAIAMVAVVGSAQGQSLESTINANIPFDFIVADKTLPAGEYSINRSQSGSGDMIVQIRSVDNRVKTLRLTNAVIREVPKNRSTLVFHRYGDQYFLFQVWPAGANTGRALAKSHIEREIEQRARDSARMMSKKSHEGETITIVGPQK